MFDLKRVFSEFKLVTPINSIYYDFVRSILNVELLCGIQVPTSCGMNQVESVHRKFLHFATYVLKVDHPVHDYTSVLHRLGLNISVNQFRSLEAKMTSLQ